MRGFAHVGALKAMNELGIFPDIISGVSAGAIVGALYADNYKPDEIISIFLEKKLFGYFKLHMSKKGLLKMTGIIRILSQKLRSKTFDDLQIPFIVSATNLNKGTTEFFRSGELLNRLIASASIPVVFPPVIMNGKAYVDGGVLNNFPVEPLQRNCKLIIGININPTEELEDFTNLLGIAERSFHLGLTCYMAGKGKKCNIFIEPKGLEKFKLFDMSKATEIFELGYSETKRILKENMHLIPK